jgi:hypothetical protein
LSKRKTLFKWFAVKNNFPSKKSKRKKMKRDSGRWREQALKRKKYFFNSMRTIRLIDKKDLRKLR